MRQFYKHADGAIAFEDSAPVDYTLVTGTERDLLWDAKYIERAEDGDLYYTQTQRNLYLSFLDGDYTSTEIFNFESHIKDLSELVKSGNWYTAQSVIAVLPLSGIFDSTKKDEIKNYIDNYVINNY